LLFTAREKRTRKRACVDQRADMTRHQTQASLRISSKQAENAKRAAWHVRTFVLRQLHISRIALLASSRALKSFSNGRKGIMIEIGVHRFRSRHAVAPESGGGSGGHMDDSDKRLAAVEAGVEAIQAQLPYLATRADVCTLRADTNAMETRLVAAIGAVDARLAGMETRVIKWMIATLISSVGAAVAVEKFLQQVP
jgi:hypothetical protein